MSIILITGFTSSIRARYSVEYEKFAGGRHKRISFFGTPSRPHFHHVREKSVHKIIKSVPCHFCGTIVIYGQHPLNKLELRCPEIIKRGVTGINCTRKKLFV
jgi:hypothetical protein